MASERKKRASKKKAAPKKKGKKNAGLVPAPRGGDLASHVADDAGMGFEDADRDAYAVPFLVILQKNSPQCEPEDGLHVDGAEPGMFFNTATQQVFDEVTVLPVYYNRALVEWVPRDQGGGFRGVHSPESIDVTALDREGGRFVLPNGNHLADTRYHFCLLLTDDGPQPVVLGLTSTQLKASRHWMTAMRDLRVLHPKTKESVRVPMMANRWRLTTVTQSNDKGTWKGVKFENAGNLAMPADLVLYEAAKEFHKQVATGVAKPEDPTPTVETEDVF